MGEELRKTGIDFLGDIPWGTHLCHFYQTQADLLDILVPFFKAGLENNEYCLWITSPILLAKDIKKALKKAVNNPDDYIQKKQLEIVPYNQWYLCDGVLDLQTVFDRIVKKHDLILKKGFDGLRLTGDTFWLEKDDWESFTKYEANVNNSISRHKIIALCTYNLELSSAAEIISVAENHQMALVRQQGQWQALKSSRQQQLEEAQHKAEEAEHFRRSMNESPLGIRIVTQNGKTVYANQAILDLYGYSSLEEYEKTPRRKRYTAEGYAEHQMRIEMRQRGEYVPSNYEISIVRKDGQIRYLDVSRKEILWHGKKHYQMLYQDITERKQAEDELKSRDEFLNTIIEQTPNAIWISDEKGTVLRMNQALRDLLKITDDAIVGKYNVFQDKQVIEQGFIPLVKSVFEEGITTNFKIDYFTAKEAQVELADHTHRILEIVISPIKSKEGKVINAICQEKDITEQEETKKALRESEAKYHSLFDNAAVGIMLTDGHKVVLCNTREAEIFGYKDPSEVVGRPVSEFIHQDNLLKLLKLGRDIRSGKIPERGATFRGIRPDSRELVIEGLAMPFTLEGQHIVLSFHADITERKRLERALRQSEETLAKAFRSIPDFVSITALKDGRFIDVNDSFSRNTGYTREEVIGRSVLDIGLYAKREDRDKIMRTLKGKNRISNLEISFRTKSGQIRNGSLSAEPIDLFGEICAITIVQDITERKRAEEALRQSEEKLRAMFESAAESIAVTDLEGHVLDVNDAAVRMYGGNSKEELIGKNGLKLISPNDIARVAEDLEEVLKVGYIGTRQYTMLRKDGAEYPGELTVTLIRNASGNAEAMVSITRDITERKRAEEALRQSEEKLRVIFQSVPDSIIITDFKGTILEANEAAIREGGYANKQELIGRNALDLISPEEKPKSQEISKRLYQLDSFGPQEHNCLRKDGTEFPGETITSKLKDANSNPLGYINVTRNISERKEAQELLQRSYDVQNVINQILHISLEEASLEDVLKQTLDLILSVSWLAIEPKGAIFVVEDKPGMLVMKAQAGLSQPVQTDCALIPFGRCLCGQAASTLSIQFADNIDECHDITCEEMASHWHCCIPMIDKNKTLGVINLFLKEGHRTNLREDELLHAVANVLTGIIKHRQTEKKMSEYEELNRMKGNILSTVSHELRTPLASIKGYATMLLDYENKLNLEEKHECLVAIDRATYRLTELIDHLLDMSRLEAGMFRLTRQPSRINPIIKEAVTEAQLRSPEHQIIAKIVKKLPVLNIDSKRILQVMDNLLDNAIKYSLKGTEIVVQARLKADNVAISVSDQGMGIPAIDQDKVFDPMYRLEERLGQDPQGLGLGLPLCKALVNAHGGQISLESTLGKGTTVHFTLPVAEQGGTNASKKL